MSRKPVVYFHNHSAASTEFPCSKIIEASWPASSASGLPAGCLIEFSYIQSGEQPPKAMIDIYRHDNAVLVRVDPSVLQDGEMPIGVTLARTLKAERMRAFQVREDLLDAQHRIDVLEKAITNIAVAHEKLPPVHDGFYKYYAAALAIEVEGAVLVMAGEEQTD